MIWLAPPSSRSSRNAAGCRDRSLRKIDPVVINYRDGFVILGERGYESWPEASVVVPPLSAASSGIAVRQNDSAEGLAAQLSQEGRLEDGKTLPQQRCHPRVQDVRVLARPTQE